jgi:hypothetical protein
MTMNLTNGTDNSSNSKVTLSALSTSLISIEDTPGVGIDNTTVAAIAGGVGAACLCLVVVIVAVAVCRRRAKPQPENTPAESQSIYALVPSFSEAQVQPYGELQANEI